MAEIGLFYGSTTGNTLKVAELIQQAFGSETVDLLDVRKASPEDLNVFTVQDDPDEAVRILVEYREKHGPTGLAMPPGMKKDQAHPGPEFV